MSRYLYGENVEANGIRQHLLRYGGRGSTVLLLPGITSPAITWSFVADRLADAFDVHVLDIRGRGLSSSGENLDYGLDALAADVAGLVAAKGWARFAILGHSMGARVAIRYASRQPVELARLVLADPPLTGPGRRAYPAPLSWYVDSIRLAQKGVKWEALKPFSPTWTEPHLRLRAEWLHTCHESAVRRAYADFHNTDIHADLPRLHVPTMLLAAGNGGVILAEDLDEIRAQNPAIKVSVIPHVGHMLPWDDLEAFLTPLLAFMRSE
jgi:N-formylmaleamate deformylase